MYDLRILATAARELGKLDKSAVQRIIDRVRRLAENLDEIRLESLKGEFAGLYKLRVGDYRIVYEIIHDEKIIIIHQIGHRSEIYRKR